MSTPTRIPKPESLESQALDLAHLVAKTSWLPNPQTVNGVGRAVFPTIRNARERFKQVKVKRRIVGMYDDNTTARWALIWPHGIAGGSFKGWTVAHVWPTSDRLDCYTHPANLVLVPESFAGMTDKLGPLTGFLRWHAWKVYGWRPSKLHVSTEPAGYKKVAWRYLPFADDPKNLILKRLESLDNDRTRILRPIMKRIGLL